MNSGPRCFPAEEGAEVEQPVVPKTPSCRDRRAAFEPSLKLRGDLSLVVSVRIRQGREASSRGRAAGAL